MKNKFTMLLAAFVAGAVIGVLIFWLLCCNCSKHSCCQKQCCMAPDTSGIHVITAKTANNLFKAYLASSSVIGADTLKAFTVNLQQFNAMKLIAKHDSSVHGFRIYMGMDSLTSVMMVVGTGSPDKTDYIIQTTDAASGPCPHVCDETSPVVEK
ncbi:MAG: hypothetical protein WCK34_04295 [Bacteroidota bacterium]